MARVIEEPTEKAVIYEHETEDEPVRERSSLGAVIAVIILILLLLFVFTRFVLFGGSNGGTGAVNTTSLSTPSQ